MTPDQRFKRAFAEATKQYGGHYLIPKEELATMGERLRADYVVERFGKDPQALSHHSVPSSIIKELCGTEPQLERRVKVADKKQAAMRWASANVGATVTAQVLAEEGDFSLSTANSLIKERIDIFRPVKRGFYLIVDPVAERAKDKANA